MASESPREKLPFEPGQKKKKTPKITPSAPLPSQDSADLSAIPDAVSQRMLKRVLFFCGLPTVLGIVSFFLFYAIVRQGSFQVPTPAVVLVTMGLFGLGVVGLTYGLLSASWDEERIGSLLGGEEFSLNISRMTEAWGSARRSAKSK